jgi:AraC family transcriptional regulator
VTLAIGGRARANPFRGLEQFDRRGGAGDIGYCIAGSAPYALEFNNDSDVICLLLGDISTETKFEDDHERPLVFMKQSAAFHPRGGNVRVRAGVVRNGFIAFSYPRSFQETFDDIDVDGARSGGSRNNIRQERIRSLADYALGRLRSGAPLTPFEIQSLAALVYLETMRCLGTHKEGRGQELSDREFRAICEFIDAELNREITCAKLAAAANVPLRIVFEGMRRRTGMSPYRLVTQRRVERACELLINSTIPISEIALLCGFSSQQHLTSMLSSRLGATPAKIRLRHSTETIV